jgi:hypothetical protein
MAKPPQRKKEKGKSSSVPVQPSAVGQAQIPVSPGVATISNGFWKIHWFPMLLLGLVAVVLYWRSLDFEYVLDDAIVLSDNQYTKMGLEGIPKIFSTESMQGYFGEQKNLVEGARYRPLSIAMFAVEYEFWGMNPRVGHAVNILVYALTVLLLYRLLLAIFPGVQAGWWKHPAFLGSMLWVTHPLHTEVVANIKGRDEQMSALLALATLLLSIFYARKPRLGLLVTTAVCFFLGLLAKENAITFLAVVPLTLWWFVPGSNQANATLTAGLAGVSILYLLLRYSVVGFFMGDSSTDLMNNPFTGMSMDEKLATVFYTLWYYVRLLFVPYPLTHDYYPWQLPMLHFGAPKAWLGLLIFLGLPAIAIYGFKSRRFWAWGIFFFLITISITSNLPFSIGTLLNERFLYLPSVGFVAAIAWLLVGNTSSKTRVLAGTAVLAVVSCLFAVLTWQRLPAWTNKFTLNAAAIKVSTNSARANVFYAVSLWDTRLTLPKGSPALQARLDSVELYADRALEIHPQYSYALTMKAGAVAERYAIDKDLDRLLEKFLWINDHEKPLPYIDQYTEYLLGKDGVDRLKLATYCEKSGDVFTRLGNSARAAKYYQYAMQLAPSANVATKLGGLQVR